MRRSPRRGSSEPAERRHHDGHRNDELVLDLADARRRRASAAGLSRVPGDAEPGVVHGPDGSARRILDERLARGEIDEDDYKRRDRPSAKPVPISLSTRPAPRRPGRDRAGHRSHGMDRHRHRGPRHRGLPARHHRRRAAPAAGARQPRRPAGGRADRAQCSGVRLAGRDTSALRLQRRLPGPDTARPPRRRARRPPDQSARPTDQPAHPRPSRLPAGHQRQPLRADRTGHVVLLPLPHSRRPPGRHPLVPPAPPRHGRRPAVRRTGRRADRRPRHRHPQHSGLVDAGHRHHPRRRRRRRRAEHRRPIDGPRGPAAAGQWAAPAHRHRRARRHRALADRQRLHVPGPVVAPRRPPADSDRPGRLLPQPADQPGPARPGPGQPRRRPRPGSWRRAGSRSSPTPTTAAP